MYQLRPYTQYSDQVTYNVLAVKRNWEQSPHLQVTVDNFSWMQVVESRDNFSTVEASALLWKHSFSWQMEKQLEEKRFQSKAKIQDFRRLVLCVIEFGLYLKSVPLTSPPLTYSMTKQSRSLVWNEYLRDWKTILSSALTFNYFR